MTDGIVNTALDLETNTQDILYTVPTNLVDFKTTSHTISFWFKLDSGGETYGRIVSLYDGGIHVMGRSAGTSRIHYYSPLISTTIYKDDTLSFNVWYHYAVVVDVNLYILDTYLNGEKLTDFSYSNIDITELNQELTIGQSRTVTTRDGDGKVDDFRIYNKALTHNEIISLNQYYQTLYDVEFPEEVDADILIVGGGGAGGNSMGGGGGAPLNVVYTVNQKLSGHYKIGVGKGGEGIPLTTTGQGSVGLSQDGSDSFIQNFNGLTYVNNTKWVDICNQDLRPNWWWCRQPYIMTQHMLMEEMGMTHGSSEGNNGTSQYNGGIALQPNTLWNGSQYIKGGSDGNGNDTDNIAYQAGGGGGAGGITLINNTSGKTGILLDISGIPRYYAAGGGGGQYANPGYYDFTWGLGGNNVRQW